LCEYFLEAKRKFPDTVCSFRHDLKEDEKRQARVLKCGKYAKTCKTKTSKRQEPGHFSGIVRTLLVETNNVFGILIKFKICIDMSLQMNSM
jgi:hypothetical protein